MNWSTEQTARAEIARWYREHGPAVRGFLFATTQSDEDADDLCQQVFARAWEARGRYQDRGTPRAYLLTIADRLVRDWRRRRQATTPGDSFSQVEDPAGENRPLEALVQDEARRKLQAALRLLSDAQRRVLVWRYYGGVSFRTIAEKTGWPLGTVLSHAHRGLRRLREWFDQGVSCQPLADGPAIEPEAGWEAAEQGGTGSLLE